MNVFISQIKRREISLNESSANYITHGEMLATFINGEKFISENMLLANQAENNFENIKSYDDKIAFRIWEMNSLMDELHRAGYVLVEDKVVHQFMDQVMRDIIAVYNKLDLLSKGLYNTYLSQVYPYSEPVFKDNPIIISYYEKLARTKKISEKHTFKNVVNEMLITINIESYDDILFAESVYSRNYLVGALTSMYDDSRNTNDHRLLFNIQVNRVLKMFEDAKEAQEQYLEHNKEQATQLDTFFNLIKDKLIDLLK